MPLVSALFMSIMLFVAFTGSQQMDWNLRHVETSAPRTQVRTYIPPARKSVIVSSDGQAQPIAAPTHSTRRDRSRIVYRSAAEKTPAPSLNVIQDDFDVAPAPRTAVAQAPAPRIARTETSLIYSQPVAPTPVGVMSAPMRVSAPAQPMVELAPMTITGTLVRETGLIDNDDSYLTEDDRVITNRIRQAILDDNALYIVSMHVGVKTVNGIATLQGEVSTRKEKEIIGAKAARVAGTGNVSNELSVLVG